LPDAALTRREQGLEHIPVTFIPTPAQWRFLQAFLTPDGPNTIKGCAQHANVNRRTVYDWFEDERFRLWFYGECDKQAKTERELMWRNARKLAIAGSPEHIKLVAMKSGEILGPGTNDHMHPPTTAVFINVPRPPLDSTPTPALPEAQQLDSPIDTELVTPHEQLR
jgi:hypothetical protein